MWSTNLVPKLKPIWDVNGMNKALRNPEVKKIRNMLPEAFSMKTLDDI